MNEPLSKNNGN